MKNLKFEKIGKELTKEEMRSVVGGTTSSDTGNKTWDTFYPSSGAWQTDDDKTPIK